MSIIIEEIVVNPLIQIEETVEEISIPISEMQMPGPKGEQGIQGLKGEQGIQGAPGSGVKITPWTDKAYLSGDQVNHLGKDWVSNAAIVAGDIPGTSSKWVERLKGYVRNNIYAIGTTGANIPSLLFIKDFSITNAVAGKIYSISSVVKNGTDTRIKIYSADDYAGTNITLKLEFILQNTDYLVLKTETLVTGEIISIIVSPAELPSAVSFTTMYGLDYKLNPSIFKNGKAGESLATTLLISKVISYFPYLTTTGNTAKLNNAIKELYLFGVPEQDVKITTFKKNTSGNDYTITIYNSTVTTKLASFSSLGTVLSGVQILPLLSTTSVLVGYVLIDWDVIVDNTFYLGVTTSDVLLTHKVFFKETNPILFTKINETRIISLESGINIGAINNYPFLVESSYSLAVNHAIKELFLFNIVEQETKITTFKKNTSGNDYTITIYNSTVTTKLASFSSLGTVLSGTQIHALITPLGDITGYVMINWDVVADGYIFQGVNNSSLILTSDVFYKLKSPKIFNYLDNLAASYDIGNYDNEFAFDLAEIERLRVRALGIIPNYNLPHTKEHGFFSTDILNELTLTDGSSDFDWIKSKAPNFYFNAKKRGCIVLFDEAGLAYIINQNNEKKFITLT